MKVTRPNAGALMPMTESQLLHVRGGYDPPVLAKQTNECIIVYLNICDKCSNCTSFENICNKCNFCDKCDKCDKCVENC